MSPGPHEAFCRYPPVHQWPWKSTVNMATKTLWMFNRCKNKCQFLEMMFWIYVFDPSNVRGNINIYIYIWLVVWLPSNFDFPINIGNNSSSQLKNSYFSEGWPNHQPGMYDDVWWIAQSFWCSIAILIRWPEGELWKFMGQGGQGFQTRSC